ncbi:hypothetical protein GCM10017562_62640 [Streptomyces roseofulvus]
MPHIETVPVGVRLSTDVEYRPDRPNPYRARVRWFDPTTKRRRSLSEGKDSEEEAQEWIQAIIEAAEAGLAPATATMNLTGVRRRQHGTRPARN